MLGLHYVPGGHGSPVCPTRSAPWEFGLFGLIIQVLLDRVKFSQILSRYPCRRAKMLLSHGGSKAHYGSVRILPRLTAGSLLDRHDLFYR